MAQQLWNMRYNMLLENVKQTMLIKNVRLKFNLKKYIAIFPIIIFCTKNTFKIFKIKNFFFYLVRVKYFIP